MADLTKLSLERAFRGRSCRSSLLLPSDDKPDNGISIIVSVRELECDCRDEASGESRIELVAGCVKEVDGVVVLLDHRLPGVCRGVP